MGNYDNLNKKDKWYNKKMFTVLMLIIFFPVGLYLMWKNKHFKKPVRIIISLIFVFMIIISGMSTNVEHNDNKKTSLDNESISKNEEQEKEIDPEVDANLNIEIINDEINVEIETNAIDGSIFEFFILDNEMNMVSEFIPVKNGKAKATLKVNEKWEPSYLAAGANMRFNLDEHPQPDNVKEAYGKNGEKLKGDLIEENNLNGYNVVVKTDPIPYPDIETVEKVSKENLNNAIAEMINISEGLIIDIKPLYKENDWSMVKVIVNDAWYYSADHEKERFAEQIGDTVRQMVLLSGVASKEDVVSVHFYDTYNKKLASPKILGGYKIER